MYRFNTLLFLARAKSEAVNSTKEIISERYFPLDFSTSKQIEKMDFYCRKIKEHLLFHEQGKTELALDKQIFGMLVHQNAASMSIKLFVT